MLRIVIKALQTHIYSDITHKNSGPHFPFPDPHLPLALDLKIWYNDPMDQEIITTPEVVPSIKRAIASSLQRIGDSCRAVLSLAGLVQILRQERFADAD